MLRLLLASRGQGGASARLCWRALQITAARRESAAAAATPGNSAGGHCAGSGTPIASSAGDMPENWPEPPRQSKQETPPRPVTGQDQMHPLLQPHHHGTQAAQGWCGRGGLRGRVVLPVAVSLRHRVILMAWRACGKSRRLTWAAFKVRVPARPDGMPGLVAVEATDAPGFRCGTPSPPDRLRHHQPDQRHRPGPGPAHPRAPVHRGTPPHPFSGSSPGIA